MKNFKKFSVKSSLAILSLAFFLCSCGKTPEHVKLIPKDANIVVAVDVKSMAVKSLDFKNFFKLDILNKKKVSKDSLAEKIKNSGIDLLNTAYVFGQIQEENGYGASVLSLSDAAKFETFVKDLDNGVTVDASGEIKTATLQNDKSVMVGWKDKTAIFLVMPDNSDKLKEKLTTLFNTKPEESLSQQNANFQSLLKETGDVSFWMSLENLGKIAATANRMAANMNFKETYVQAKMNFEKGEVVVDTKYFTNKETADKFSGMTKDKVSEGVVNALPGNSVIALLGFGLDLNKLYAYLEKENMVADLNQNVQGATGMEAKEIFQIFSGDMGATLNGLKTIMTPEFAVCLGVSDKDKLAKLLTSLSEKGMLQKTENYYSLPGYFVAEKDNNLIIGPESMRKQLMDGSGDKLSSELKGLLSSNASAIYFNITNVPDEILAMAGEKTKNSIRKSSFESITITGNNIKDNISTGKLVVAFKNKDENSLVTISKISDDMAAAEEAEPSMEMMPVEPGMPVDSTATGTSTEEGGM